MPTFCRCGSRLRVDKSCPEPTCVRFRPGLRGKNFSIRVVRRLKGKQSPSGKAIKLGKHYRLNSRELHCSKSLAAVAAIPGASPSDPMALASGVVVRKLLRAACLEVLLVDMYGEVEYFSVMAVAFRRRDSPTQFSVQCVCVRAFIHQAPKDTDICWRLAGTGGWAESRRP